jgi:serine/threonine protein kinase
MASSKALATTRSSRGTDCYRAPEVLNGRYNNRSDMFALGCIIFKIVTGEMVFGSDWYISEYARGLRKPIFPDRWPIADLGTPVSDIGILASDLLAIDPTQRPGAGQAELRLYRIGDGSATDVGCDPTTDVFFHVDGRASNNDVLTGHPAVQSGLKFATPNSAQGSLMRFPYGYTLPFVPPQDIFLPAPYRGQRSQGGPRPNDLLPNPTNRRTPPK